jgi:hypothetical protein
MLRDDFVSLQFKSLDENTVDSQIELRYFSYRSSNKPHAGVPVASTHTLLEAVFRKTGFPNVVSKKGIPIHLASLELVGRLEVIPLLVE